MKQGLAEEERKYFDEKGFLIFENVLSCREVAALSGILDDLYASFGGEVGTGRLEVRNCVAQHPLLLELIEHPNVLPIIVDLLGSNIKIRSSHLDVRPPLKRESITNPLGQDRPGEPEQWHVDGPLYGYPTVGGILPMMEVKVGYYLTDVIDANNGPLCVVPGSHKLDYRILADENFKIPNENIFRVQVTAGSIVIFRTGLWHCVAPNFSNQSRKVLYYAYTYRWIEASDYIMQSEELISKCTPIQRQLLGAPTSDKRNPLGTEAQRKPYSFNWFPELQDIPLIPWFEEIKKNKTSW